MRSSESSLRSFYRRPLPANQIAFASEAGRRLFREALEAGFMEGWFALAEQFHTQSDPTFCGLGTLVVALNALEIDPGRVWKGPWRWYGEELLDCCQPLEKVQQTGLTLDEVACLARCNGARASIARADGMGVEALRESIRSAASTARGRVVVASYSRAALGQTGAGHFSPIAGHHPERDLALVLDVARFKYPPHWVPIADLWRAMTDADPATGRSRGWLVLERSSEHALPVVFRLVAPEGLTELACLMREAAVRSLEGLPTDDLDAFVRAWIPRVEDGLGARLSASLQRRASAGDPSPEHAASADAVLAELRASAVHRAIAAVRASASTPLSNDALALLLLLIAPTLAPAPGPALAGELVSLRKQLDQLQNASCAR